MLLTNADLDHVLGLFSLREGGRVDIHATPAVRATVERYLGLADILGTFSGVTWHAPPVEQFEPLGPGQQETNRLMYRAIQLPGKAPPFAKAIPSAGLHSVAYQFMHAPNGKRLLVAPDVGALNDTLLAALTGSDAVLFDGTFWSSDELSQVKPHARKAHEMGHVTIRDDSLCLLSKLSAHHKIYIHINNTNPILAPDSPERAAVEDAGVAVGVDGMEFEL